MNTNLSVKNSFIVQKIFRPLLWGIVLLLLTANLYAQTGHITPLVSSGPPGIGTISGSTTLTQGNDVIPIYTVSGTSSATSYAWSVLPSSAGSMSGTGISGSLNLNASFAGSATIHCVATNSYGSTAATPLTINVIVPVIAGGITPAVQTINMNTIPAALSSSAATGGNGVFSYQWQTSPDNNNDWVNISGAITTNYSPPAASGIIYYRLKVTSGNGQIGYSSPSEVLLNDCYQLNTSPAPTSNYIISTVFREAGITSSITDAQIASMGVCDANQTIQYLDGLGRPIQTIQVKASQAGRDVVQPISYDQYGREVVKYLPYSAAASVSNGAYESTAITDQTAFYNNPSAYNAPGVIQMPVVTNMTPSSSPTNYEPSPLNRIIEQGAPGAAWQLSSSGITGSGHTIKTTYSTNANTSEVTLWTINSTGNGATGTAYYPVGSLFKTITTDEMGNNTYEYKNLQGQVVCKTVLNGTVSLSTYYVYDIYNNLTYVIPPVPSTTNPQAPSYPSSFLETDAVFVNFIYGYHYDNRNRIIQKKNPGKGWDFIIYNLLDQVVMTQDANQRNKTPQQWTFIKYNGLGKEIITGIYPSPGSTADNSIGSPSTVLLNSIQSTYNTTTNPKWENRNNATASGYDNLSDPNAQSSVSYLTINYYDDYNFIGQPSTFTAAVGSSNMTKGLPTATKTNILGTATMLWAVNYYDDLGRITQTYKQHYLSAVLNVNNYDLATNSYDFNNRVTTTLRKHYNTTNTSTPILTIANTYLYDHEGRKKQTWEQINGGSNVLLVDDEYNEIGQLMTKNLHAINGGGQGDQANLSLSNANTTGTYIATNSITLSQPFSVATGSTFSAQIAGYLQSINYTYNERGWLSSINNPATVTSNQVFGEQLQYNTGTNPQYNGNISGISWQTLVPPGYNLYQQQQSYAYVYDNLNRLTQSNYTTSGTAGKFNELAGYDVMGNIINLQRTSTTTAGQYLNSFTYDYTSQGAGNKLWSVLDVGTAAQGSSYQYDANGNVVSDTRNKIINITYNLLNLPQLVTRTGGNIIYIYDANGNKLEKISGGITRDYISGIEYNNGAIEFINTEEGRAIPAGGAYSYEYYLKDHLGNTRADLKQDGSVEQVQDYYAFGLEFNPGNSWSPSPPNQYKYNGKEEQVETGQYDYGARFYDPVIARWTSVDPVAEKMRRYSAYNYGFDNPIKNTDPDGMAPRDEKNYDTNTGQVTTLNNLGTDQGVDIVHFGHAASNGAFAVDNTQVFNRNPTFDASFSSPGYNYMGPSIGPTLPDAGNEALRTFNATIAAQAGPIDYNDFGNPNTSLAIGNNVLNTYGIVSGASELKAAFTATAALSDVSTLYHSTSSAGAASSILEEGINPAYFNSASRFGGGFYMSNDVSTAAAELSFHGSDMVNTIRFNPQGASYLNATSPVMDFGVKYAPKFISNAAQGLGYDGIIYNSLRGTGENVVQFSNFSSLTNGTLVK